MIGQELGPVERSQENLCGGHGGRGARRRDEAKSIVSSEHCSGDTINMDVQGTKKVDREPSLSLHTCRQTTQAPSPIHVHSLLHTLKILFCLTMSSQLQLLAGLMILKRIKMHVFKGAEMKRHIQR